MQKSVRCEYTRQGYVDPYEVFRSTERGNASAVNEDASMELEMDALPGQQPFEPVDVELARGEMLSTGLADTNDVYGLESTNDINIDSLDTLSGSGCALNDVELGLDDLDWDSLLAFPEVSEGLITSAPTLPLREPQFPNSLSKGTNWPVTQGFHVEQLDSVESKVIELRNFLRASSASICDNQITSFITREKLLRCIQLYGIKYHPVMPMLHIPTFELVKTDQVLLLAMMLVGACYSDVIASGTAIIQFAVHVLLTIEALPVSLQYLILTYFAYNALSMNVTCRSRRSQWYKPVPYYATF